MDSTVQRSRIVSSERTTGILFVVAEKGPLPLWRSAGCSRNRGSGIPFRSENVTPELLSHLGPLVDETMAEVHRTAVHGDRQP